MDKDSARREDRSWWELGPIGAKFDRSCHEQEPPLTVVATDPGKGLQYTTHKQYSEVQFSTPKSLLRLGCLLNIVSRGQSRCNTL